MTVITYCSEADPTKFNKDPPGLFSNRISGVGVTHITPVSQVFPYYHLQSKTCADLYKASAAPQPAHQALCQRLMVIPENSQGFYLPLSSDCNCASKSSGET